MVKKGPLPLIVALVGCCAGGIAVCMAQQIRYMDSSGNLHFVDSVSEVPSRYRQQVVPYTPTPVLDARQQRLKMQQEQAAQRQRERLEREKMREAQRQKMLLLQQQERRRKKHLEEEARSGFKKGGG